MAETQTPEVPATTEQVVDETVNQETVPVTTSVESTETPAAPSPPETPEAFDAASYEASFGLPQGELDGVENAEDALVAIRNYTDKTLTAGLGVGQAPNPVVEAAKVAKIANTVPAGKGVPETAIKGASTTPNPELDELRAELKEVKDSLVATKKRDYDKAVAEINHRVEAEIDKWASPLYGTSKSRNYKQTKSKAELNELIQTHLAGFDVRGKTPPVVESLLRQVRTFHDDTYVPTVERVSAAETLGAPGTGSNIAKKTGGPANIHEALMGNSYD